jgi:hypothetical protein
MGYSFGHITAVLSYHGNDLSLIAIMDASVLDRSVPGATEPESYISTSATSSLSVGDGRRRFPNHQRASILKRQKGEGVILRNSSGGIERSATPPMHTLRGRRATNKSHALPHRECTPESLFESQTEHGLAT